MSADTPRQRFINRPWRMSLMQIRTDAGSRIVAQHIVSTRTPAGVGAGRRPPLWMRAGDCVEVEVPGIGVLSNPVIDES